MCTIVYVDQAESTNSLLAASAHKFEHGTAIAAHAQTNGRGQRGNQWESEPGKNLTFSLLLLPSVIVAARQFEISQIVAIAITKVLRSLLGTDDICIKWPNDIYYKDSKVCGILIENAILGASLQRSIIGVGINVNQTEFVSDAPNPTSMALIAGKEFDLDTVIELIVTQIVDDFNQYEAKPMPTTLAAKYSQLMWRAEGFWPYRDNITGQSFSARITALAPDGHMTLVDTNGMFHTYAFKEVTALI